ncbi:unnamed protein product [Haemonchus placei]|uniref:Mediator of RNA polymerase II transcription subunit 20 n=1 Tax=Haemonchus placei TaxID=6290 RepID=A0A0N4XAC1_HAEPC|nr:unnamed protein product [Haemonchus placei]
MTGFVQCVRDVLGVEVLNLSPLCAPNVPCGKHGGMGKVKGILEMLGKSRSIDKGVTVEKERQLIAAVGLFKVQGTCSFDVSWNHARYVTTANANPVSETV